MTSKLKRVLRIGMRIVFGVILASHRPVFPHGSATGAQIAESCTSSQSVWQEKGDFTSQWIQSECQNSCEREILTCTARNVVDIRILAVRVGRISRVDNF